MTIQMMKTIKMTSMNTTKLAIGLNFLKKNRAILLFTLCVK